jgi:DNA-nicking Smr family endonuclease
VIFTLLSNAKYDDYTIDLHGQLVTEAMQFVEQRVEKLKENATQPLDIITGTGNHSDTNGAKIKPAVEKYLKEQGLSFTEINNGTYRVTLF